MLNRFQRSRAPESPLAGLTPVVDRHIHEARLPIVLRQDLRLRRNLVGESFFQYPCDPRMQVLPLVAQKGAIGSILDERMLEQKRSVWRHSALEEQS